MLQNARVAALTVLELLRESNFHSRGSFPWSRKFSTVKKIYLDQGTFLQSKNISTVKNNFPSQANFPQSWKSSTNEKLFLKNLLSWLRKFSTNNKVFRKDFFSWSRKFSINKKVFRMKSFYLFRDIFHKQIFLNSRKNFWKERSKRFTNIFNPLLLVAKGQTYLTNTTLLSMCKLLLLSIKKLILLIESTSVQTN